MLVSFHILFPLWLLSIFKTEENDRTRYNNRRARGSAIFSASREYLLKTTKSGYRLDTNDTKVYQDAWRGDHFEKLRKTNER